MPQDALSLTLFGGSKAKAAEMGFTSINYNGRTFHFHKMDAFNNPAALGAPGYQYVGSAIVLPASQGMDAGGNSRARVEMVRWGENGGVNTMGYQHLVTDSIGYINKSQFAPSTTRTCNLQWFDTFGMEIFGAKQMYYVQRS
jgi:hypothetical protein